MKIYITRPIPENAYEILKNGGLDVEANSENRVLSKQELIAKIAKRYDKKVYALNGFSQEKPSGFAGVYGTNNLVNFDPEKISEGKITDSG